MTDHEHRPDYAAFHSRRRPKHLTCTHCGKSIRCTNSHLSWLLFIPVVPAMIAFNSRNRIAMFLSVISVILLIPPLQRLIFPHLRFELDHEDIPCDLKRRRF